MVPKPCCFVVISLVSEWPMRQYQAHHLNHFSLANMVGRTARTLPLAAVSVGRAHRGWQAHVSSKGYQQDRGWQAHVSSKGYQQDRGWQARVN
jgi:hypothetical protein